MQRNTLGFKFGASLIALLIDAQSVAQKETMKAVAKTGKGDAASLIKFESLDHFALESIDL